jgi:hypothetical protein
VAGGRNWFIEGLIHSLWASRWGRGEHYIYSKSRRYIRSNKGDWSVVYDSVGFLLAPSLLDLSPTRGVEP